jgi:uncharacterized protein
MSAKDTPATQRFPPGTRISERKRKLDGTEAVFSCDLLALSRTFAMVLFVVERPSAFVTPVPLPRGTRSYGFFWRERPFNAYRFVAADGAVLAHRFDALTALTISRREIAYRDLVLDWWALPDDTLLEEDRDEYQSRVQDGTLTPADIRAAESASRDILSRYRHLIDELERLQHRFASA